MFEFAIAVFSMLKLFTVELETETSILAQLLHHEARGEMSEEGTYIANGKTLDGQIAIAEVVLNRVKSCAFPNTLKDVILQPYQFTDFELGSYEYDDIPIETIGIASHQLVMYEKNVHTFVSKGANHYHSTLMDKKDYPYWADDFEETTHLGNHIFYREIYNCN